MGVLLPSPMPSPTNQASWVLDTNIVLDIYHFREPALAPLAAALQDTGVRCLVSPATLDELARVLGYPQFRLDPSAQAAIFQAYRQRVTLVEVTDIPPLPRCRDRDDQKFLELAAVGGAQWLISKDKEVLRLARRKLAPAQFLILSPLQAVAQLVKGEGA